MRITPPQQRQSSLGRCDWLAVADSVGALAHRLNTSRRTGAAMQLPVVLAERAQRGFADAAHQPAGAGVGTGLHGARGQIGCGFVPGVQDGALANG